jgi:diketogulonate reductase-like aldo/keto reductase
MEYETVQGVTVPAVGLGTARMTGEACERAVSEALELGYRHLDTAQMYDNEAAVGTAIADSAVDREAVFLTTKLLRTNLRREDVFSSFDTSLDRLGTDYVDLLLIHAPSPTVPLAETLGAMNDLQEEGRVRHVGVSNFNVYGMESAVEASRTPILTNQVEYNPFTDQSETLAWCLEHDVLLTAYSPLNVGRGLDDDALVAVADRYGKTPAQVAIRWLIQQDHVVAIPKAARREHLDENLDVFDFRLTDEEMRELFDLADGLVGRLRSLLGL